MTIDRQSQPPVTFLKLFLELQLEGLLKRIVINQKHPSSPTNAATIQDLYLVVLQYIYLPMKMFFNFFMKVPTSKGKIMYLYLLLRY